MGELLCTLVGWLYLSIKYRNREKIKRVLNQKYDGSYSQAGVEKSLSIIGILVLFLVLLLLLSVIYSIIKFGPS
ncbi:hypothetical protein [uncultured Dokdonia sp.]|uniref:hypothetical protein n=1 Tax=uncultured Dokdonia sp. TaxID=575653 RepID=UPI00263598BC|nr:hypothetical protein [uncultured Dokdonia sp.]